ncbi:MAG: dGTP triphosphohydrolase, partial [Bacteroidota bacterium]
NTQVMTLPIFAVSKPTFVHTRLTHSLEVSVVGRSLGRIVGQQLLHKYPILSEDLGYRFNDFGSIVAAAALAHYIGNPPFGHSGEKAIGHFFKEGAGAQYTTQLTEKERQDLWDFEGNANGFKLLTASRKGVPGGLRLSYATLGAFIKYPKPSLPKRPSKHISDKKYGFFQSEQDFFLEVAQELGLQQKKGSDTRFHRHPLTYLVEAADDICYTIIDFEDGINLGLIPEDFALEYLIKLVKDKIDTTKYHALENTRDRLAYLRALSINVLVTEAAQIFMEHEEAIRSGQLEAALLEKSTFKPQIEDILKISVEKVYRSQEVIERELAGYKIIATILGGYAKALVNYSRGKESSYDRLLLRTLPEELANRDRSTYELLLGVSSFVAGLSDSNAVQLSNKILGRQF